MIYLAPEKIGCSVLPSVRCFSMVSMKLFWLSVFCFLWSPMLQAASWQVVTHKESLIQPLTTSEVKYLFTEGRVQGYAPELIDLAEESLRASFYQTVLNISLNRWRANWAKRVFAGTQQLPKQLTLDYVVQYLATNPNAVAYLPDYVILPVTLKVIYCDPRETPVMGQQTCPTELLRIKQLRNQE